MTVRSRRGAGQLCGVGFLVAMMASVPAVAQVTQTDAAKTPLPQPVPQAEVSLINDSWAWNANTMVKRDPLGVTLTTAVRYGDFYAPPNYPQFVTGDAINLQGLFKWRKETLDPTSSAKTGPGYFSGKCGFSAELLLMGSNCQVQFGWYNVTDPTSKTPPAASEVYPFMSGKPRDQLNCVEADGMTRKTDGFCPLAWDNRHPYDLSIKRWTPKQFPSGDISKDPRYKGGYIAFAVIGDASICPQNKYSMYEHNQRNSSNVPWVQSLLYHSTVDDSGFYMAFEDLAMSAADWKKTPSGGPGADGDFNDLVFYVSGLTCAGGNLSCDTGQFGACAAGHTDCAVAGEAAVCLPTRQASAERCDNVDNDCDGVVDDGAGLCADTNTPVCFRGECVGSCKTGAFSCPVGSSCNATGECVDPVCAGVSCKPGSTCKNGTCFDQPCAGVLCPYGTQCELGRCVDPCAGVSCTGTRVCERGRCVAPCSCNGCESGLTCGADGRCSDASCANKVCESGTICQLGACVDPCTGVTCPGKGVCSAGVCYAPPSSAGAGGSAGGLIFNGGSSGTATSVGGAREESAGAPFMGGAAGDDEAGGAIATAGRNARAGATAAGGTPSVGGTAAASGVETPDAPSEKSSSCGYAVLAPERSARLWPVLGLAFASALLRRRRVR